MMFTNLDLRKLLIPLIVEQVLTSLMGIARTPTGRRARCC